MLKFLLAFDFGLSPMPAVKGKDQSDDVIIIEKGSGNKKDKVSCINFKSDSRATATSHNQLQRSKSSQALIVELKAIEKSKVETQREAEIYRKLERNFTDGRLQQKFLTDSTSRLSKILSQLCQYKEGRG